MHRRPGRWWVECCIDDRWRGNRVCLGAIHGHGWIDMSRCSRVELKSLLRLRRLQNVVGELAFLFFETAGMRVAPARGHRRRAWRRGCFSCDLWGLFILLCIFLALRVTVFTPLALLRRLFVRVSRAMHKAASIKRLLELPEFLV